MKFNGNPYEKQTLKKKNESEFVGTIIINKVVYLSIVVLVRFSLYFQIFISQLIEGMFWSKKKNETWSYNSSDQETQ